MILSRALLSFSLPPFLLTPPTLCLLLHYSTQSFRTVPVFRNLDLMPFCSLLVQTVFYCLGLLLLTLHLF